MMTRTRHIILPALMLVLFTGMSAYAAAPFQDVAGTPYEAAVTQLYNDGIVNGYGDGTFAPYGHITRAEACKILAGASGIKDPAGYQHQFRDMAGYSWANGYVGYAVEAGLVKGYPDGTFRPGSLISEDEMITLLVRTLGYTDSKLGGTWPGNYIAKGAELGLTDGTGFSSAQFATRGMAALLTYNTFYRFEGSADTDLLGIVIEKTDATAAQPAKIKVMDQTGAVRTFNVPVQTAASRQWMSGDIVGLDLDSSGVVTSLVVKDAVYVTDKKFEGTTSFAGIDIHANVAIFTYGEADDFKSGNAVFSTLANDYGVRSVRLMKNVTTSAYYVLDNGDITAMIVPTDEGYSGRMYGLISEIGSAVNLDGDLVESIDLLIGKDKVDLLSNGDLDSVPAAALYDESGSLFELNIRNGVVRNIADSSGFGTINGDRFVELTSEKDFQRITEVDNMFVDVETDMGTERFGIMDDVVVYVLEKDGDYASGSDSKIDEGARIRAYDVTDDGVDYADVVVIDERLID